MTDSLSVLVSLVYLNLVRIRLLQHLSNKEIYRKSVLDVLAKIEVRSAQISAKIAQISARNGWVTAEHNELYGLYPDMDTEGCGLPWPTTVSICLAHRAC
jgi:hypothetical protein